MTPMQTLLYAATLFLALASLLKWKYRREVKAVRMQRSLRIYTARALAELSSEMAGGLSAVALGRAC